MHQVVDVVKLIGFEDEHFAHFVTVNPALVEAIQPLQVGQRPRMRMRCLSVRIEQRR